MSSLAKISINAAIWNFAGGGGRAIAQLFIQVALARILGPEVFGQYAIVLAVLGIGWLIADSGFGAALIQKTEINDADVGYALAWVLVVAAISGGTIAFAANEIAVLFSAPQLVPVFRATGLLVVLQAVSNIPASLMRRALDAKRLQLIQLTSYVFGFGLIGITLAIHGWGIWSLIASFLTQTLISTVAMYCCVLHTLRPRLRGDPSLRNFGFSVVLTNAANWAIENLDRMVVGKIWGMPALGAYSVTINLSRAPVGMLVGAVQSVVFASGSKVKEDLPKLRRGYLAMLGALMLVALPLFSLLGLAAHTVIDVVYGERWNDAAPLFQAFAVSTPLYIITAVTGPLLWSVGKVGKDLRIQIFVVSALMAAFWIASDLPLSTAVWLIPALYLIRAVLIVGALAQEIDLRAAGILQALRGGILISISAALVWFLTGLVGLHGNAIDLLRIIIAALFCALLLFFSNGYFLGVDTKALLLSRKHDSSVARFLLRMTGTK